MGADRGGPVGDRVPPPPDRSPDTRPPARQIIPRWVWITFAAVVAGLIAYLTATYLVLAELLHEVHHIRTGG